MAEVSAGAAATGCVALLAGFALVRRRLRSKPLDSDLSPAVVVPAVVVQGRRPRHVAVIMDGNRRYGERKFGRARRLEGHHAGGEKLGHVVDWCVEYGVREVTCFAFSTENWKRDRFEVEGLMRTFVERCTAILQKAHERQIRCRVLCTDDSRLPPDVREALETLVAETRTYAVLTLNLAVSYGARSEILQATRRAASEVERGLLRAEEIDEATFGTYLQLDSEPDLLIRTSGEHRLSNFLLWQLAYTELVFLDKFWPDLEKADFVHCLDAYARRNRRFGA